MAERILIWGAGAIGGSVGAWLKRAGHDIGFVDVELEQVDNRFSSGHASLPCVASRKVRRRQARKLELAHQRGLQAL
jgi:ketopantoate reductase